MGGGRRQGHGVTPGHLIHNFFFFCMQAGRMAVARQGGWATQGAAEGMQLETLELDESMRGDDGVKGDVRDVLHEAVGVRPTQCAQWVHCALKGAKTRECDKDGRWSAARLAAQDNSKTSTTTRKSNAPTAPNNRGPRTEDRGPRTELRLRRSRPCGIRTRNLAIRSLSFYPLRCYLTAR